MRKILLIIAIVLLPTTALAQNVNVSTTETGVTAGVLATGATTNPINLEGSGYKSNQVSWTLVVTPGTSTSIQVSAYECETKAGTYLIIPKCNSVGSCTPWVRTFTLSDYATVGGKKYIVTRWSFRKPWSKLYVVDGAAGSGTVAISGTRSWQ